jgi:hypothetical protein
MRPCPRAAARFLQLAESGESGEIDTAGGAVEHARSCADCSKAIADARRFRDALSAAARATVAQAVRPDVRWRPAVVRPDVRHVPSAAAVVLVLVATIGGALAVWRQTDEDPAVAGSTPAAEMTAKPRARPFLTEEGVRRAVVAATRAEPAQIVRTEDGAVALAHDGEMLSLVLVRPGADGPDAVSLGAIPLTIREGAGVTAGTIVACPDLGLVRDRFVMGYIEPAGERGPVLLEGLTALGGSRRSGMYLFAIDPGYIAGTTRWGVAGDRGKAFWPAAWLESPQLMGRRTPAGCFIH